MNCGRMRCQASDNFTYGSCVDKTLIYTDELWFTPQNVEEGKCILEGTETYVNVKHQNERLLKRTPSLSTSNDDPWRHVPGEKEAMNNRVFMFQTYKAMPQLKEWGTIELNPIMWLTIWRKYIDKYNREYVTDETKAYTLPRPSGKYKFTDTDIYSPAKKIKLNVRRNFRLQNRRNEKHSILLLLTGKKHKNATFYNQKDTNLKWKTWQIT